MSEMTTYQIQGYYRPCPRCDHPMVLGGDGKAAAPGGLGLRWQDRADIAFGPLRADTGRVLWLTPHAAGCEDGTSYAREPQ